MLGRGERPIIQSPYNTLPYVPRPMRRLARAGSRSSADARETLAQDDDISLGYRRLEMYLVRPSDGFQPNGFPREYRGAESRTEGEQARGIVIADRSHEQIADDSVSA